MPGLRTIRLVALLAVAATIALSVGAASVTAATAQVDITEANSKYSFSPKSIHVTVGDTVHWQNKSDEPHTVTSDGSPTPLDGQVAADDGSFDFTFVTAGTYAYHCDIHDYMKGVVTVSEAGSTPPPTDAAPGGPSNDGGPAPIALLLGLGLAGMAGGLVARRRLASARGGAGSR